MATTVHTPVMQLRLAGESTEIDLDTLQGLWSDEQYLRLTAQTNRLIEFTDGFIEVLPMPTDASGNFNVACSVLGAHCTAAR